MYKRQDMRGSRTDMDFMVADFENGDNAIDIFCLLYTSLMQGSLSVFRLFMFLLVVSRLYDPLQGALQNLAALSLIHISQPPK